MNRYLFLFCFSAASCCFAQVDAPRAGVVHYLDGSVRPVFGVTGSFIVGKSITESGRSASFSDRAGIVFSDRHLSLLAKDGSEVASEDVAASDAVVHIEGSPTTAIAWLPQTQSLVRYDGSAFHSIALGAPSSGEVISVRASSPKVAALLISDGLAVSEWTVDLDSGNLLSQQFLPGITPSATYVDGFIAFQAEGKLWVQGADGSKRDVPLTPKVSAMEKMSDTCLHIVTTETHQDWVLHLAAKELSLWELPGPPSIILAPKAVTEGRQ